MQNGKFLNRCCLRYYLRRIAILVSRPFPVRQCRPDWAYVPNVLRLAPGVIRPSYTPHAEGDVPAVVMEFLSVSVKRKKVS